MEIRYLKTFKTIAEMGSFTKAAEYLGYAQSTITFHIKSIEDELGSPVFDRIGRKVFLTETGELLMPHVIKMLCIYRDLKEVTSISEGIKGELVISAPEALLIYRLPPVIKEFKEKYPNVDIKLKHLEPTKLKTDLAQGDVDLAFIIDMERKQEGIYFEKLITEPMMLISQDFISLRDKDSLKNRVFLFTEEGCSYRMVFEKLIDQNISNRQPIEKNGIEFWSIDALKESVICGLGIGVLPYITVKREITQKQIFAQEINKDYKLSTYLAYHKDKWISPSLKAFLHIVRKFAGEWETESYNVSRGVS
jgi:DNA-binding transcriptional LysR family regulator